MFSIKLYSLKKHIFKTIRRRQHFLIIIEFFQILYNFLPTFNYHDVIKTRFNPRSSMTRI